MSSSSEALFVHIANFLKFISSAQLLWFMLNTSYDHGCHLASRFRLDPEEYEALLIVVGLVSYMGFGFQIPNQGHGQLVVTLPLLVLLLCRPFVFSSRRLFFASPLNAPSSCCLVVSLCRLSLSCRASWLSHHHLSQSSRCTAFSPAPRDRHNDGKGKQGVRRHDDGNERRDDGWRNIGKGQQGDRQHNNGDGKHDEGKGQQGDRRHDDGSGRHDDGDGWHDDGRHDDGKGPKEAAAPLLNSPIRTPV